MNKTMPHTMAQPQHLPFQCQSDSTTMCSMEEEPNSPHFLAQDLNNEASALIAKSKKIPYAIKLLTRALELSRCIPDDEDENDSNTESSCECERGSLDACLFQDNHYQARKRSRYQKHVDSDGDSFVFRRPLRVSQTTIQEKHYMGSTLTVMILFNLALAHQLLGMAIPSAWPTYEDRFQNMDRALKLYELCIHASDGCECSDAASLRLKLLVMNNLSQIHKISGIPKKYRMCLEFLLRAMMFVAHGHEGEWDMDYQILTPFEIDAIYRNMQSSSVLMGKEVHAAAA